VHNITEWKIVVLNDRKARRTVHGVFYILLSFKITIINAHVSRNLIGKIVTVTLKTMLWEGRIKICGIMTLMECHGMTLEEGDSEI